MLADKAKVRCDIPFGHAVDESQRAVDRRAFFIAGNDTADRAGQFGCAGEGGDEAGDAALHVDRAAAVEQRAFLRGFERIRSEAHTSELQSLMRISYAVFCL